MNLTDPRFQDADEARKWLEAQRWPRGPVCSHCGSDNATSMKGKAHRPGLYQCKECREQFTVTTGTVMERSKVALNKWLMAMHLMSASKKGVSAHQLHRMLGVTYKTAWFMAHRIREAMRDEPKGPVGGEGKIVEADETYFGKRETPRTTTTSGRPFIKRGKGPANKRVVVSLVERGGNVRSFHIRNATKQSIREILVTHADRASTLHTDESRLYTETGTEYAEHATVHHASGEYVRGVIHTNTIENVFSVFKRGMRGVYQHCGEAHLFRYLAEFDFRYNHRAGLGFDDTERCINLIRKVEGKRLTYRRIGEAANA